MAARGAIAATAARCYIAARGGGPYSLDRKIGREL